jgi:hypothetical protein
VKSPLIQRFGSRRVALLGVVLVTASSAGCGETGISLPLQAGGVNAVPGAALTGPAGAFLPDPVQVIVLGTDNQPLPGTTVTFSASQGGSVDPATAVTNGNGIASTRWKLGNTAGANVLTATAGTGVSTTISATATAARPASVALVAGNSQTASAGSAVAVAPSVRVVDAFGNLVANATVTFTPVSGGGNVTNGVRTTNAQGVATVAAGSWDRLPVPKPSPRALKKAV